MTRTWKVFSLQTILAAALVAAPSSTFEAKAVEKINGNKELAKKIETLETDIKNLKESVVNSNEKLLKLDDQVGKIDKGLKGFIDKVGEDMSKVLKTLDDLKAAKKNGSSSDEEADDIKARLARIERILDRLGSNGRIRRYPPPDEVGRVVMTNRYPEDILFIVNGTRYWLAPGTSRALNDIPAGAVRYQVVSPTHGLIVDRTRTLLADGNLPIVVREPRSPIVDIERG